MDKKDLLKKLEDLYNIRELKEGFKSKEELISWSNKVLPLLKRVDLQYYYNFLQNSQKFNFDLSSVTLIPAFSSMKSQLEMAMKKLKFKLKRD